LHAAAQASNSAQMHNETNLNKLFEYDKNIFDDRRARA